MDGAAAAAVTPVDACVTDASLHAYALLLARHTWQTHIGVVVDDAPSGWPWWDAWSADERHRFFRAVRRHSRHRPDLVALEVPTKTLLEVSAALRRLHRYAKRERRAEARARPGAARRERLRRLPRAHEMSDHWMAYEDAHAEALARRVTIRPPGARTTPIGVPEQLHALALFLYHTRADHGHLSAAHRDQIPEPLYAVVQRWIQAPARREDLPALLTPTPAYVAWAHMYPAPMTATPDDVDDALRSLIEQGYLVWADARPCPPDGPRAWAWDVAVTWAAADRRLLTELEAPLGEIIDPGALQRRCDVGEHVSVYVRDELARHVRYFLTRVLYDVVTVTERAGSRAVVDAQQVWAAVVRLGWSEEAAPRDEPQEPGAESAEAADGGHGDVADDAVARPHGSVAAERDEAQDADATPAATTAERHVVDSGATAPRSPAPEGEAAAADDGAEATASPRAGEHAALNPDVLEYAAPWRMLLDPPVAWTAPPPRAVPGEPMQARVRTGLAWDDSDSATSVSETSSEVSAPPSGAADESDSTLSYDSAADVAPWSRGVIGEAATLVPYEYAQAWETSPAPSDDTQAPSDAESISSALETDVDPVERARWDDAVDAEDCAAAAQYEARYRRVWLPTHGPSAAPAPRPRPAG